MSNKAKFASEERICVMISPTHDLFRIKQEIKRKLNNPFARNISQLENVCSCKYYCWHCTHRYSANIFVMMKSVTLPG